MSARRSPSSASPSPTNRRGLTCGVRDGGNDRCVLHADRFPMAEHPAIDAEELVPHLEAFRLLPRFLVCCLTYPLQLLDGSAGERIDCHIPAVTEGGLKLLHHQKNLAVVGAAVIP